MLDRRRGMMYLVRRNALKGRGKEKVRRLGGFMRMEIKRLTKSPREEGGKNFQWPPHRKALIKRP